MSTVKTTIFADGMTCPACEARIEKALLRTEGVASCRARVRGGRVEVEFDSDTTNEEALKECIQKAGYAVRKAGSKSTPVAIGIGVSLSALYLLASASGLFNAIPDIGAEVGLAMLFVVGLLTSVHCVAMCGGIALSQSVRSAEGAANERASRVRMLTPGLLYNGGRLVSYTALGGIAGAFGSAFSFSPVTRGVITALAGVFMVLLGLKMLGVLREIPSPGKFLGESLRLKIDRAAQAFRAKGPFAVGLLNGFMPCGPLQTMQLYALGTGSALAGAASMFMFSLGTIPLMLIFALTAAFLPRKFVPAMVKASAVLVMVLGTATLTRAGSLAGVPLPDMGAMIAGRFGSGNGNGTPTGGSPLIIPTAGTADRGSGITARVEKDAQYVTTEFTDGYYVPFTVQAGIPLKWTIRVTADDLNGCNNPVEVPRYGIKKILVPGENLIEFTPGKEGVIPYNCWMGMIRSRITVVSDMSAAENGDQGAGIALGESAYGDTETIGMPEITDGVQRIRITVNEDGYFPSMVVLQRGMNAVFRFDAQSLTSCNTPVVFPEYNGMLDLRQGQFETPPIPINGDFSFQCWMGMIRGSVKVVDDLNKVDADAVRAELALLTARGGDGCCAAGTR